MSLVVIHLCISSQGNIAWIHGTVRDRIDSTNGLWSHYYNHNNISYKLFPRNFCPKYPCALPFYSLPCYTTGFSSLHTTYCRSSSKYGPSAQGRKFLHSHCLHSGTFKTARPPPLPTRFLQVLLGSKGHHV